MNVEITHGKEKTPWKGKTHMERTSWTVNNSLELACNNLWKLGYGINVLYIVKIPKPNRYVSQYGLACYMVAAVGFKILR